MSESMKARLLAGAAKTDTVYLEELDETVTVRALTDGEAAEAKAAALAGQVVSGPVGGRPTDQNVDVQASAKGQSLARQIKAAYGLSVGGEKWKPAEVAKLPASAVRKIAEKVDELSGGDELLEEARRFRELSGRAGDGAAASDGGSAGVDSE